MTACFTWVLVLVGLIFVMTSMIRWFEQVTEAVDKRSWNKLLLLVIMPPAVWLFPSRISAGRPTAVPRHSPVMGMGTAPKPRPQLQPPPLPQAVEKLDEPPPGTPKEFRGMPLIPPKKPTSSPAIDPDKLARLKQKMREQGMLDE